MASDVCKHCTHAACLDVCPDRRDLPHRVRHRRRPGRTSATAAATACRRAPTACSTSARTTAASSSARSATTACKVGQEPACAKACPTDSIQFGELDELRERAGARVEQLHEAGVVEARLYGHDPDDGVGGDGAFFLLLDEPEVYGLPPDPVVTTRDLPAHVERVALAAALAARQRRRRSPGPAVSDAEVTREGLAGVRPGRESRTWSWNGTAATAARAPHDHPGASYYGRPIINPPVWEERDIAGYLFTGGLAGASSILAAGADLSGRPRLARGARAGGERRDRRLARGARARPRPAGAVPQHAARVQADLADERRQLDPRRPTRRCASAASRQRSARRAPRGPAGPRASAPACSARPSRPTPPR